MRASNMGVLHLRHSGTITRLCRGVHARVCMHECVCLSVHGYMSTTPTLDSGAPEARTRNANAHRPSHALYRMCCMDHCSILTMALLSYARATPTHKPSHALYRMR